LQAQSLELGDELIEVGQRLPVTPTGHVRGNGDHAGPRTVVEPPRPGNVLGPKQGGPSGIVAAKHEVAPIVPRYLVGPLPLQVAVVGDSSGDVRLGVVDRRELGVLALDLLEGGRHELHESWGPATLLAAESSPVSVNPCALNSRQSQAGPKYRLRYLRKI
jgi:hypothetical protein